MQLGDHIYLKDYFFSAISFLCLISVMKAFYLIGKIFVYRHAEIQMLQHCKKDSEKGCSFAIKRISQTNF
jgi:hypothetical protein